MQKQLLKNGQILPVDYQLTSEKGNEQGLLAVLDVWQTNDFQQKDIGVLIPADTALDQIANIKPGYKWLGIAFDTFTDGRGFSIAAELRAKIGYEGDIRACGNVIPDQIAALIRCGFTSIELNEELSDEDLALFLTPFSQAYQTSEDLKTPLFERVNR